MSHICNTNAFPVNEQTDRDTLQRGNTTTTGGRVGVNSLWGKDETPLVILLPISTVRVTIQQQVIDLSKKKVNKIKTICLMYEWKHTMLYERKSCDVPMHLLSSWSLSSYPDSPHFSFLAEADANMYTLLGGWQFWWRESRGIACYEEQASYASVSTRQRGSRKNKQGINKRSLKCKRSNLCIVRLKMNYQCILYQFKYFNELNWN